MEGSTLDRHQKVKSQVTSMTPTGILTSILTLRPDDVSVGKTVILGHALGTNLRARSVLHFLKKLMSPAPGTGLAGAPGTWRNLR